VDVFFFVAHCPLGAVQATLKWPPRRKKPNHSTRPRQAAAICVQLQHSNDKFCPEKDINGVLHLAGSPDEMIWL